MKKQGFTLAVVQPIGKQDNQCKICGFTLSEGSTHIGRQHNPRMGAFTLSEVLITLGIIAVVAIMTIPSLINNTQQLEFNSAIKKFYSSYLSAQTLVNQNDGGFEELGGGPYDASSITLLGQYMVFTKTCNRGMAGTNTSRGCWHDDNAANPHPLVANANAIQYYAGQQTYVGGAILSNGMLIALANWDMFVDVNGFKGPNSPGKDVWEFTYNLSQHKYVPNNYNNWGGVWVDSSKPFIGN